MRNLINVIDDMLDVVPKHNTELIEELERIKHDQIYRTAPESMVRWEEVSYVLMDYIPIPKEEWEFKVLSIWSTKSIEELKEYAKTLSK